MGTRLAGRDLTLERLGTGLDESGGETVVSQPSLVNNLGLAMAITPSGTGWAIVVSGNADYAGSYFVENAALLGGLPLRILAPAISSAGGVLTARKGLWLSPLADPATLSTDWIENGVAQGNTGTSYTPVQASTLVEWREQASNGTGTVAFSSVARAASVSAAMTGGTTAVYQSEGSYWRSHSFLAAGTLTVSRAVSARYLVVHGGGAGGANRGGGGGGGDVLSGVVTLATGSQAVVIGAGGIAAVSTAAIGGNGGRSSLGSIGLTEGAPGGGGGSTVNLNAPSTGGSGGGGWGHDTSRGIGGAAAGLGYKGGDGLIRSSGGVGGGGGGAGGIGLTPTTTTAGNGGPGVASAIQDGTTRYYGAGGGGGADPRASAGLCGAGGSGVGGRGSDMFQRDGKGSIVATAGTNGTGSGGGGGGLPTLVSHTQSMGANGGSGVVIVAYAITEAEYLAQAV